MDSDLPLLEISGEDDSLIQQTPALLNDAVKVTDTFFSLSPLQLPISPINQSIKNNVAPKRPSCSSPKTSNKENMNFNKAEGPKLTPHQMKRRKRGYNLRKSLAWDKAFFTEEGVLDPDELSMISGTYGNSCGEALSAISEDRTKSPYSSSKYRFASENLQAFSATKNRNNGGLLLPHCNLLAADRLAPDSKVTQEVHSNSSSCNRSGVKIGRCPRPLPPSSLKRSAHVHNIKSAKKDSHLPKIPDYKSGLHSLPKTSKISMLGTSQLKHNQIAHSTVITHKNISLESSCKNVKSTQNKEKSGPKCTQLPSKASAQPSGENMVNSSLEVNLLTNPQTSQIRKPRSSEANLKPVILSSTVLSGEGLYRPKAVAGLLPQSTSITVGNESQLQKMKPSGLRMPSPSLGYFGQNNTQPSNIPKCTAIGSQKFVRDFRAPHAPRNKSMDIPENSVTAQCLELGASKAAIHKAIKSDLMVSNIKNGNIPLLPDKSSVSKRSKHEVHGDIVTEEHIGRHGKHKYIKDFTCQLDSDAQITSDLKVLESGTCEKLREDNYGGRVLTQCQNKKMDMKISLCKPENISTSSDLIDGQLMNQNEILKIKKKLSISSDNLEPQSFCLGVEQNYQCNSAIYSEEFLGEEANAINEFVILERNEVGESESSGSEVISAISLARSQDGEFGINRMTEKPPLEAQSGFVEASPPVKIQDSSTGPCSKHKVEPIDNASTSTKQAERGTKPNCTKIPQHDAVPFSNEWLASADGANEERDDPFTELPEPVKLFTCDANQVPYVESHSLGCDISKDTSSNMEDNDLKAPSSCGTERKSNDFLCKSKHSEQENEANTIVHQLSTSSDLIEGQLRDHNVNFNIENKSSDLLETLEVQSPCLKVEQNYQCNPQLYSKEFRGKKVNASDQFVILERSKGSKSETYAFEVISALSPAQSQDTEFDINRLIEQPPLKEHFDLVEVSPAVDIQDCSTDTHFRHGVLPIDNATSLNAGNPFLGEVSGSLVQCNQALLHEGDESDAQSFRNNAIMECVAADSWLDGTGKGETVEVLKNDYTGRIVEESSMLRASSGSEAESFKYSEFANLERSHDDTNGVDNLSSKSHVQISHWQHTDIIATNEQFNEESNLSSSGTVSDKCSGDSGNAHVNDSDATLSIRKQSERGTKPNSLIIPPPDAVPFSDEWLAAIEAAGEDILTKKSGAVQNSPPDKSLPEPSPWSPVKRKTNEIGPYDCTKCINTQPADL